MNIVNINLFLGADVEASRQIKRIPEFDAKIEFKKNSFTIENSLGIKQKVYPKSFEEVSELEEGFNTIDFFAKDFLKKVLKANALISSVIRYEANVCNTKGYIMDCYLNLDGDLEELYNKEMQVKAAKYFGLM